jgi:hypothetical protein
VWAFEVEPLELFQQLDRMIELENMGCSRPKRLNDSKGLQNLQFVKAVLGSQRGIMSLKTPPNVCFIANCKCREETIVEPRKAIIETIAEPS